MLIINYLKVLRYQGHFAFQQFRSIDADEALTPAGALVYHAGGLTPCEVDAHIVEEDVLHLARHIAADEATVRAGGGDIVEWEGGVVSICSRE